jgi:uncharacterized protein with ParB-like and HNH nuclease domain
MPQGTPSTILKNRKESHIKTNHNQISEKYRQRKESWLKKRSSSGNMTFLWQYCGLNTRPCVC